MVESMARVRFFGMIGTLIGLVFMMIYEPQDPNSFSSVGAGMAVLLTTLWRDVRNMVCKLLADKLGRQFRRTVCNAIAMQAALMILEGVRPSDARSSFGGRQIKTKRKRRREPCESQGPFRP